LNPGLDLSGIEKVAADVSDVDSLRRMAQQCDVVINCVGPYRFYGENVVKACIAEGTHHVDVSGEPQFLEKMQLLYHKEAEAKGVYIVGACGFDSIPADMGTVFLQNNFKGKNVLDFLFTLKYELIMLVIFLLFIYRRFEFSRILYAVRR